MTDDDMPGFRAKLERMNERARMERFVMELDDLLTEFEETMADDMPYTIDELIELIGDDLTPQEFISAIKQELANPLTSAEEIAALKVAEMATRMNMTPMEVIDHFYSKSSDDLTSCSQHEVVMVDRALLNDLDQALFAYAPHQTKQLRVRLLNAISAASVVHYEDMTDTSAEEIAALKVSEMAKEDARLSPERYTSDDCVMVNPWIQLWITALDQGHPRWREDNAIMCPRELFDHLVEIAEACQDGSAASVLNDKE